MPIRACFPHTTTILLLQQTPPTPHAPFIYDVHRASTTHHLHTSTHSSFSIQPASPSQAWRVENTTWHRTAHTAAATSSDVWASADLPVPSSSTGTGSNHPTASRTLLHYYYSNLHPPHAHGAYSVTLSPFRARKVLTCHGSPQPGAQPGTMAFARAMVCDLQCCNVGV